MNQNCSTKKTKFVQEDFQAYVFGRFGQRLIGSDGAGEAPRLRVIELLRAGGFVRFDRVDVWE